MTDNDSGAIAPADDNHDDGSEPHVDIDHEFAIFLAQQQEEPLVTLDLEYDYGRLASQVLAETPEQPDWLVPGLLVPGWTTKLAGREKDGKGTYSFYLIGCLERNEPTAHGESCGRSVTTLVFTEEPIDSIREKLELFGIEQARIVEAYRWASFTWDEKVARLFEVARLGGHGVILIDNISRATGIDDENGVELARCVEALIDAARNAEVAVLLNHHHRKKGGAIEDRSRGGTGLAAATDINVELTHPGGEWTSRKRKLNSRGRLGATVWEMQIELSEDGSSYSVTDGDDNAVSEADSRRLFDMLALGPETTVQEFAVRAGLTEATARRRLQALVAAGEAEVDTTNTAHVFRKVLQVAEG